MLHKDNNIYDVYNIWKKDDTDAMVACLRAKEALQSDMPRAALRFAELALHTQPTCAGALL